MSDTHAKPSGETGATTAGGLVLRSRAVPATRDGYGPLGAYTGGAGEAPVDSGLDLLEYWRILNRRKYITNLVREAESEIENVDVPN